VQREEEKALFDAIDSSLIGMRSNVIQIIFEYSLGIVVRCCNEWNCVEEIHFASRFLMEVNAQQNKKRENKLEIYQYFIHCKQITNIHPNVLLFGKKRRIFCKDCTENELETCILCDARVDVGGVNDTSKCQMCLDMEHLQSKQRALEDKIKRNKERRAAEKLAKRKEEIKKKTEIDHYFMDFLDNIYPRITVSKVHRNRINKQRLLSALKRHGMHIENLPYCLWSERCKLMPNCRRQYCAYYHNWQQQGLGKIIFKITKAAKESKRVIRRKEFHYYQNQELMAPNFMINYVEDKMNKKMKNGHNRKYNETMSEQKKKAHFLRKKDKRGNAKQNKIYCRNFKGSKYAAEMLIDAKDYCRTYQKSW